MLFSFHLASLSLLMVETISVSEESSSSFLATRVSLIGSGHLTGRSLAALSLVSLAPLAGGAAEVPSCQLNAANKLPKNNRPTSSDRSIVGPSPQNVECVGDCRRK